MHAQAGWLQAALTAGVRATSCHPPRWCTAGRLAASSWAALNLYYIPEPECARLCEDQLLLHGVSQRVTGAARLWLQAAGAALNLVLNLLRARACDHQLLLHGVSQRVAGAARLWL